MEKKCIKRERFTGKEIYRVTGITTEKDYEIIEFCDRNAFGGRVCRHCGEAIVEVYID